MPGPTTRLADPDGIERDVPTESVAAALANGWRPPTAAQDAARLGEQATEATYGGVGGAVKAGAAAVARGATLGGFDLAARAIGGEDAAFDLSALREAHPYVSTAGEIAGALAPALLTGGGSAEASAGEIGAGIASRIPAGAVAKLGAGIARAGADAGIAGKVGAAALGGAVEGGLYGAGQAVSNLSLSSDPLTVERVAQQLGSNVLFGAATGGIAGAGTKLAEIGLGKAKGAIDAALESRAAKALTTDEAIASGDLEHLDTSRLKVAREQEIEAIHEERAPARTKIVDELKAYRDAMWDDKLTKMHYGIPDGSIREAGGSLGTAERQIRKLLDKEVVLAKNPARALESLQQQEQAMTRLYNYGRAELDDIADQIHELPATTRSEIMAQMRPGNAFPGQGGGPITVPGEVGPFTAEGLDAAVERAMPARLESLKAAQAKYDTLYTRMSPAIDRNRQLQNMIANVGRPLTSDRLTKIDAALEVLAQPRQASLGDVAVSTLAPFAGPLGVAAVAGGKMLGKFRELAAAAGERAGKSASAFLAVAERGARKAGPGAAAVAATTAGAARRETSSAVLGRLRYADDTAARPAARGKADATPLVAAYKARTAEIRSQTAYDETGVPRLRPEARAKMAARLDPIRHVDPALADRLETAAARRIEYLSSIMPRHIETGGVQIGPDRRQPSDAEMRSWARSARAAEDPHGVLERATHGQITPEDAATMRALHPAELGAFTSYVGSNLGTLRKTLPAHRRLALYILTGVPVDAAHVPATMRVIQAMYSSEPGTDGGTQAPRAEPQFGSVKAAPATQAQQRQAGSAP